MKQQKPIALKNRTLKTKQNPIVCLLKENLSDQFPTIRKSTQMCHVLKRYCCKNTTGINFRDYFRICKNHSITYLHALFLN